MIEFPQLSDVVFMFYKSKNNGSSGVKFREEGIYTNVIVQRECIASLHASHFSKFYFYMMVIAAFHVEELIT